MLPFLGDRRLPLLSRHKIWDNLRRSLLPLARVTLLFYAARRGLLPFLLALPGAKIIDLDNGSRVAESWAELRNPRVYYDFFRAHEKEFER